MATRLLRGPHWRDPLLAALLFASFFLLYHRAADQHSSLIYWLNNRVFYSDTRTSYSHMKEISFEGDMRKHPLYSVVVHPLLAIVKHLFDLGTRDAARAVVAFLAAVNGALFYLLARRLPSSRPTAFLFAAAYGLLFANLVFFSIPETYSLSTTGILLFFLLLTRFRAALTPRGTLVLGSAAGVASLLNPPLGLLLGAVVALAFLRLPPRRAPAASALAALPAAIIYLAANLLLFGTGYFEYSQRYAGKWAALSNLFHLHDWLNVGSSFFVFGAVSPLDSLQRSIGLRDWGGYFTLPAAGLATLGLIGFAIYTLVMLIRRRDSKGEGIVLPAAAWLAAIFVFYVYFNPKESLLYASQALGPFVLILARRYEIILWRWKWTGILAWIALAAWANISCVMK